MLSLLVCIVALGVAARSDFDSGFVIESNGVQSSSDVLLEQVSRDGSEGSRSRHQRDHSSRHSDDDSDGSVERFHHKGRLQNKVDEAIEAMIESALELVPDADYIYKQAYQARFGRNTTTGFNNVNSTAFNRTVGPVLIIAKTTTAPVTADSYDGNNDGQLDVLEAHDAWKNALTTTTQATEVDAFMRAIRNRAQVNGGSIGLRSLVLSGRTTTTNKKGVKSIGKFFTFSATTVLISPCFSMTTEPNYHIVVYAGGIDRVANATLLISSNIFATQLINGTLPGGAPNWLQSSAVNAFTLARESGVAAGTVEGFFTLQQCTQHSYFQ